MGNVPRSYSARIGVYRDINTFTPVSYLLSGGWPGYGSIPVFDHEYLSLTVDSRILDRNKLNLIITRVLQNLPGNNFMFTVTTYDVEGISRIDVKFSNTDRSTFTNMNDMLRECPTTFNPFTGRDATAFFFTITFEGIAISSSSEVSSKETMPFDFPYILSRDNLTVASVRIEDDSTLSYTNKQLVEGDKRLSDVTPGTLIGLSNDQGVYKLIVTLKHLSTGIMNVSWDETYCPFITSITVATTHLIVTTSELVPSISIVDNINHSSIIAPGDLQFIASYPSDNVVFMTPNTLPPNLFTIVPIGTELEVTFCIFALASF